MKNVISTSIFLMRTWKCIKRQRYPITSGCITMKIGTYGEHKDGAKIGIFTTDLTKNEETAARASDALAIKLMANGEQNHKLNFPDEDTEVFPDRARKRKRPIMKI